jgi:hypothetical protein
VNSRKNHANITKFSAFRLLSAGRQWKFKIIALELDRLALEIDALAARLPPHPLATGKKATASNVDQGTGEVWQDH